MMAVAVWVPRLQPPAQQPAVAHSQQAGVLPPDRTHTQAHDQLCQSLCGWLLSDCRGTLGLMGNFSFYCSDGRFAHWAQLSASQELERPAAAAGDGQSGDWDTLRQLTG